MNHDIQKTSFIPVSEWEKKHPWPKVGGLRHLIFHSKRNGFNKVIVRAGRRILIDEAAFFQWLDEHREVSQ